MPLFAPSPTHRIDNRGSGWNANSRIPSASIFSPAFWRGISTSSASSTSSSIRGRWDASPAARRSRCCRERDFRACSPVAGAKLVVAYVKTGDITPIPYLRDLLEYEEAMMVVESGARVWRETPTHDSRRTTRDVVERTEGTVLLDLDYDLPLVLPQLLRQWETVPQQLRQYK